MDNEAKQALIDAIETIKTQYPDLHFYGGVVRYDEYDSSIIEVFNDTENEQWGRIEAGWCKSDLPDEGN